MSTTECIPARTHMPYGSTQNGPLHATHAQLPHTHNPPRRQLSQQDKLNLINTPPGTCFFVRLGYWSYEVCPWQTVRQYHVDNLRSPAAATPGSANERRTLENLLGKYEPSYDVYTPGERIYSQRYLDGDGGREVTVRYVCRQNARQDDGIATVSEPSERVYLITLQLASVCVDLPASMPAAATSSEQNSVTASVSADIALSSMRLLEPLEGAACFYFAKDYWNYEFCPNKSVRQFHEHERRISAEFLLGAYDETADRLVIRSADALPSATEPMVAHHQRYVDGTGGRSVTVRVRCSWRRNEHTILSVEEPEQGQYVLDFSSPLLCDLACVRGNAPR